MGRLDGEVAIVVGGGRGLGRAIALAFAREGATLVVAARTQSEIEEVARAIQDLGAPGLAIVADATVESEVDDLVRKTLERFGQIDILVNCAGEALIKPTVENTVRDWDRILNSNLKTAFLTSRAVLGGMMERGSGQIINVSSRVGQVGSSEVAAYAAAKAGVIALTQSLAKETKNYGIQVTCMCPGPMDTPMRWKATPDFDPEQALDPTVVAELAVLLVSRPDVAVEPMTITSLKY